VCVCVCVVCVCVVCVCVCVVCVSECVWCGVCVVWCVCVVCVCVCVICTKFGMNVNATGDTPTTDVRRSFRFRTESIAVPSVEPEGSVTF